MRRKSTTIQDIARRVGVSKTTVSRYLNEQFGFMSQATQEAISKAIVDLNYRPSTIARSLKSKRTTLVGVVIHSFENQIVSLFLQGICDVLYDHGYSPVIFNSYNGERLERQNLEACLDQLVEGIILSPSSLDCSYYTQICQSGTPVVMANRHAEAWAYDAAYIDHYGMVRRAVTHLWENDYRRIAFITNNRIPVSTKARRESGYLDAFADLCPGEEPILFHLPREGAVFEKAQEAITDFLQRYPLDRKAVVCADVTMLQAVIAAVHRLGLSVPAHMGICGYDARAWGQLVHPGITSMDQPFLELGRTAAQMLMDRCAGVLPEDPQIAVLKGSFTVCGSTGRWG